MSRSNLSSIPNQSNPPCPVSPARGTGGGGYLLWLAPVILLIILVSSKTAQPQPMSPRRDHGGSSRANPIRWELMFVEDFEKGAPGRPVGPPWVQRHPKRQILLTDQVAASGKQCATFRYEVSAEGSLDSEAGLFAIEAPIPRPKDDPLGTWRISAAMRFHPIAWNASSFRLRGNDARGFASVYNSMNMLILGGPTNMPVWNVAQPDRWYRLRIVLREKDGSFDLETWEEGQEHHNFFYDLSVSPESLPLKYVSFGYVGALVRYGQGRVSFLDDVRVERLVKEK